MRAMYNVTGDRRKALVDEVSAIVGWAPVYTRAPRFAYVVHNYTIDRDGTLSAPAGTVNVVWERLLDQLAMKGFQYEAREDDPVEPVPTPAPESSATQDGFTIGLPLEGFTDAQIMNLERLVASKAALLKKALGADTLTIERTEDRLQFPWFRRILDGEEASTYSLLIIALVEMAKRQKRISATERPVDSERFAFRIFLLRLGFGGPEHAANRKLLLRNLTGPSAFPSAAKAEAHTARWRDRRAHLMHQTGGDSK